MCNNTTPIIKNNNKKGANNVNNKKKNKNESCEKNTQSSKTSTATTKCIQMENSTNMKLKQQKISLNIMILICCIVVHSFYVGYNSSSYLKEKFITNNRSPSTSTKYYATKHKLIVQTNNNSHLPIPTLHPTKELPKFKYTYRHFDIQNDDDDDVIIRSSHTLLIEQENYNYNINKNETHKEKEQEHQSQCHEEEEMYEPAGQHLLLDIKNVNSHFLNSEYLLSKAIIKVINKSQLTLLSYHCHGLYPTGVSCVGVLLESHISLHTWPEDGVILLDLFTCGNDSLLPLVNDLFHIFGHASSVNEHDDEHDDYDCNDDINCKPRMVWSHKLRGFRHVNHNNIYDKDIGKLVLDNMLLDYKNEVVSTQTKDNLAIDIYDIIDTKYNSISSFESSTNNNHNNNNTADNAHAYRLSNPQYYKPNRHIFLNGMLHKNSLGYDVLHESFIHPGLFCATTMSSSLSSKNNNVWIAIGGGDGGVIQQLLKHNNVQNIVVNEPYFDDNIRKNIMNKYLPQLNDCSKLSSNNSKTRTTASCYDNDKVHVSNEHPLLKDNNQIFDIVILDAPLLFLNDKNNNNNMKNTKDTFYNFVKHVLNDKLNENGIIIMKLGLLKQKRHHDNDDDHNIDIMLNGHHSFALQEFKSIFNNDYEDSYSSMHFYQESHVKFTTPAVFCVVCRDSVCTNNWKYQSTRNIKKRIHELQKRYSNNNSIKTNDNNDDDDDALFHYFDAAVFHSYRNQKLL